MTDLRHNLRRGQSRLDALLEERMKHGSDTDSIDAQIWELFGEDWAVMFTDLCGFSRTTAKFGIIHFLQVIHEHHRLVFPPCEKHGGFLLKVEADSLLLMFRRPESAVRCAIDMQHACQRASSRKPPEEQILLCLGIGFGRVLRIGEEDVFGHEVNAASKLGEDTAERDQILVTSSVRKELERTAEDGLLAGVKGLGFEPLGQEVPGSPENYILTYPHTPA